MAASIPVSTLRQQDRLRQSLMQAIQRDDCAQISALVQQGAPLYAHYYHKPIDQIGPPSNDPHFRDLGLVNPVDWAVLELRFRAAMQLLELGDNRLALTEARPRPAGLHEIDLAGGTKIALNLAARHGHLGLLRMLLERGASVSQPNLEGMSALRVAVAAGKAEAAALLLQYGAWESERSKCEVVELAWACKVSGVFVAAGISLEPSSLGATELPATHSPTPQTVTPVHAQTPRTIERMAGSPSAGSRRVDWQRGGASSATMEGTGRARSQSPRPDGLVDWGWAPFQTLPSTPLAAAGGGATTAARPGVAAAAHELNSDEVRLRGELARAIRKGDMLMIEALVNRGVPLEAAFDLGYGEKGNCVDWACVSGRPDVAATLLDIADARGLGDALATGAKAALFWAVSQGYTDLLRLLLQRGADVAEKSPFCSLRAVQGDSLLAAAVFGGRKAETLALLSYGAWDLEGERTRRQLLEWALTRRGVAEAFHEAGVCDLGGLLAPLDLPYREHGIWEPDYPTQRPLHWTDKEERADDLEITAPVLEKQMPLVA